MERWTRREVLAASALGARRWPARKGMASPAYVDDKDKEKSKAQPAAPASRSCWGSSASAAWARGLLNIFKGFPDVPVAAVCDVYEPHLRAGPVGGRRQAGGLPATSASCSTARTSTPS